MGRTGSGIEVRPKSIRFTFLAGKPRLMVNGEPAAATPANVKWAHRLAAEIREKIKHGTFSMLEYFPAGGVSGDSLTVAGQLDAWLASERIEHSTHAGYSSACKFWKEAFYDKDKSKVFGPVPLRSVKHSFILTIIASRPELSGKTINNYVSVLRKALELAVRDNILSTNPVDGVPRAAYQKDPPDPFTLEEAAKIIAYMKEKYPEQVANLVEFWFNTGMRTSEIAGLRWRNIDMNTRRMIVREATVRGVEKNTTKTGVVREVRLDNAFAALLRQRKHTQVAGEHVFLDPRYGTPWVDERAFRRSYWTPCLKVLGIRYRRPYNMRHTRATQMLMAKVNPAFAAKQLGHSIEVFLKDYTRWLPGDADDAEMGKLVSSHELPTTTGQVG